MVMKKIQRALLFLLTFMIPFVSAQYGYGYGYSIDYYLSNPNALFVIVFIISFALIYYALNKQMHNSRVSGIIAFGVSLLISLALSRSNLWAGSFGGQFGGIWGTILLIAGVIAVAIIFKLLVDSLGNLGAFVGAITIWILLRSFDPYQILPYQFSTPSFFVFYDTLKSIVGLFILIGLAILYNSATKVQRPLADRLADRFFGR
jgi:hypothetical protein